MQGLLDAGPLPQGFAVEAPAAAGRIVMGQLMARCPDCPNAQHRAWADWFYCWTCYNGRLGNALRPMSWPEDIDAIVAVLMQRPPANRNWQPGETVEDLQRENVEHGVATGGVLTAGARLDGEAGCTLVVHPAWAGL